MELFTIGYQNHKELDTLLPALEQAGVAIVVDVRARAGSWHKPDFSRSRLRAGLAARGIAYLHLRALGNPDRQTDWGERPEARGEYRRHLDADPAAREEMLVLAALAPAARACLLCLEARPRDCHRSVIVEKLLEDRPALEVVDLV